MNVRGDSGERISFCSDSEGGCRWLSPGYMGLSSVRSDLQSWMHSLNKALKEESEDLHLKNLLA